MTRSLSQINTEYSAAVKRREELWAVRIALIEESLTELRRWIEALEAGRLLAATMVGRKIARTNDAVEVAAAGWRSASDECVRLAAEMDALLVAR